MRPKPCLRTIPEAKIEQVRACLSAAMTRLQAERKTGLTCAQLHYVRRRYLPELSFATPPRLRHLPALTAMRAEGLSLSQIAHRLGLSRNTIKDLCRRHKIKGAVCADAARWSIARQRRMAELSRQGMSADRIAAYLGESIDAVRSAMTRLGLFARSRRERVCS